MKKIVVFTLSLCLSLVLGIIVELISDDLFLYAKEKRGGTGGQPMPHVTQWIFDVFGVWNVSVSRSAY